MNEKENEDSFLSITLFLKKKNKSSIESYSKFVNRENPPYTIQSEIPTIRIDRVESIRNTIVFLQSTRR